MTLDGAWVTTSHRHAQERDEAKAIWDRCKGEDARVALVQDTDLGEDAIACSTLSQVLRHDQQRLVHAAAQAQKAADAIQHLHAAVGASHAPQGQTSTEHHHGR